jgi:hypothetical protein
MDKILELDEINLLTGNIYKITNIKNNKIYIGQAVSHRLNKNKYRPFGYIGRFKDHISEAINNTKKKQCTYLNNAIRKYGKESFKTELLIECPKESLDNNEIEQIKKHNSLYPNGYNLTNGGKTFININIENNQSLNDFKKRGREFGYKHNEETKLKIKQRTSEFMKKRLTNELTKQKLKQTTSENIKKYYDDLKIKKLSEYEINNDLDKYIRPVINKKTNKIHNYQIYINRRIKFTVSSVNNTLEEKYERLKKIFLEAVKLNIKNKANKSENCENEEGKTSEMGNQQPSS